MEEQPLPRSSVVTVQEDVDRVEEILMEREEDRSEESWKIHSQQDLVALHMLYKWTVQ